MAHTQRVWHIVNYEKLFFATRSGKADELEAVQYTPRHVMAPWDAPAIQVHLNRMAELKELLGFIDYLVAKELYERLLDRSQLQRGGAKYLRGYVVDANLRPVATGRVAVVAALPVKPAEAQKALKALLRVGLIEQIGMPESTTGQPGPEPEPEQDDAKELQKQRAKNAAKYGKKSHSGPSRAATTTAKGRYDKELQEQVGDGGTIPEPFRSGGDKNKEVRTKNKEVRTRPSASADPEQRIRTRPSASADDEPRRADGDARKPLRTLTQKPTADAEGRPLTQMPKGNADRDGTLDAAQDATGTRMPTADADAEGDAERDPHGQQRRSAGTGTGTATQPIEPMEAEVAEGPPMPEARTIRIADQLDRLYDQSGGRFADEVCRMLRVPHPPDTREYRRQHEAIASAWQRAVLSKLTPSQLAELWGKSTRSAERIGAMRARKRAFRKGPEAVWMHEFNQRLGAMRTLNTQPQEPLKRCKVL